MNSRKMKYDLTGGGILDKLMLVAVPIMGTQLMQMAYNLTDMFWLGRLSSDAVAASGTAGMFMWLSVAFMLVGRMGAEIGVSQCLGRGDESAAKKYSQNAVLLAVALGILFGLAMAIFRYPLVGFFNIQEAHVAADTRLYLLITSLSFPMTFVTSALVGTFNGSGNSRTPFWMNAVGLAVNIILDPILIFTAGLGITGAAWATVVAQLVTITLMITMIRADKNRPFAKYQFIAKPDIAHIRQIFKWTIPIGVESMLFTALSMIISRYVAAFGAPAITVSRIGSQVESLSWLIGGGFGSALTAFIGQNFGAGKWTRIHRGFKISLAVMVVYGIAVSGLLYFCGGFLFSIFIRDPEIIAKGVVYLKILASCQILMCIESVTAGGFRGTGRTIPPSIVSITTNTIRVPMAYFLSKQFGLNGIWIGVTLGAVLRGIWSFVWYMAAVRKQPKEDVQPAGN